jgi:thiaminase
MLGDLEAIASLLPCSYVYYLLYLCFIENNHYQQNNQISYWIDSCFATIDNLTYFEDMVEILNVIAEDSKHETEFKKRMKQAKIIINYAFNYEIRFLNNLLSV